MSVDNSNLSPQRRHLSGSMSLFDSGRSEIKFNTDDTMERIWTVREVADLLRVSTDTVMRRFRAGVSTFRRPCTKALSSAFWAVFCT